jgi:hypothetical protein
MEAAVNKLRLASMEQIADAATDDVFARLNAEIRDVAEKMGQEERDAIGALMGKALTEQVGIEVLRGSYLDGDTFRWKTQVRLNPDVPAGEVRYRSGITTGDL